MTRPFAPLLRLEAYTSVSARRADLPFLRRTLLPVPGVRILDVGGGTGAFADLLARDGAEVVVLEPNPKKIAFARSRFPNLRFVEGGGESIPFPDRHFHRTVAMLSFHHAEDQGRVLGEVRRVLAPGGTFLLQEIRSSSGIGRILGLGTTHRFWEPEDLRQLLESHGFRDAEVHPATRGYFLTARPGPEKAGSSPRGA